MFHLRYDENGYPIARLKLYKRGFLSQLQMRACAISVLTLMAAERPEVETFISDVYADAYHAAISIQYRNLMSVRDDSGRILAALGFRSAADSPLFLENYLPAPIDEILATPRHKIVEIGNLASSGGGASSFLFAALSAYLFHQGFTQAVVTGTASLEKRLRKMGLKPRELAIADANRLPGGASGWGSYYESRPKVLSGSIADGYRRLQKHLGAEYTHMHPRLHVQLEHKNED